MMDEGVGVEYENDKRNKPNLKYCVMFLVK